MKLSLIIFKIFDIWRADILKCVLSKIYNIQKTRKKNHEAITRLTENNNLPISKM